MLRAIYDLEVSPTGFDFVTYLSLCEIARRKTGFSSFKVFIIPARSETGFWNSEAYPDNEKRARLTKLIIPLTSLFINCSGIEILSSRSHATELIASSPIGSIFPSDYDLNEPPINIFHWAMLSLELMCGEPPVYWSAPKYQLDYIDNLLRPLSSNRKIVTITLREANYHKEQNSNLIEWGDFSNNLNKEEYLPIIVRDTETANNPLPEYFNNTLSLPEASIDVKIRAALMQRSDFNLLGPCGPILLSWNNPSVPSLSFSFLNYGSFRNTPTPIRALGIEPGRGIPGLPATHAIDWNTTPETSDNIRKSFYNYIKFIPKYDQPIEVARRWRKAWTLVPSIRLYTYIRNNYDGILKLAALCGLSLLGVTKLPLSEISAISPEISAEYIPCLEIGDYLLANNAKDKAIEWYNRSLLTNPNNPEALHSLARINLINGDINKAYYLLNESISLDSFTGKAYYDLGEVLLVRGEDSKAIECFYKAALNEPSHEAARARLTERGIKPPDWEGLTLGETPDNGANNIEFYLGKSLTGDNIYYKNGLFYSSGIYSYSMAGILRELARKDISNIPSK